MAGEYDIPVEMLFPDDTQGGAVEATTEAAPASAAAEEVTTPPSSESASEAAAAPTHSFTSLDPQGFIQTVPEELRAALEPYATELHKGWQGDFTRKTQELAAEREAIAGWKALTETYEGLEPPVVENVLGFVQKLEAGDQETVIDTLTKLAAFAQQQGWEIDGLPTPSAPAADDAAELGLDEDDPAFKKLSALEQRLARFEQAEQQRLAHEQQVQAEAAQKAELDRVTSMLAEAKEGFKKLDPSLKDEELDAIIALGAPYGDPQKGYELFKAISGRQLENVLESKTQTPAGVKATTSGANATHGAEEQKRPTTSAEIEDAVLGLWSALESA